MDPLSSKFYAQDLLQQKKGHIPDTIWPLTNDVVVSHSVSLLCNLSPKLTLQSQQIFMYLEEIATLHCKDVSRRKATTVKLLWPEVAIFLIQTSQLMFFYYYRQYRWVTTFYKLFSC